MVARADEETKTEDKQPKRSDASFVICSESFVGELEPEQRDNKGTVTRAAREVRGVANITRVRADSEIARRFAPYFRPMDGGHYGDSMDATRDPGRQRGQPEA